MPVNSVGPASLDTKNMYQNVKANDEGLQTPAPQAAQTNKTERVEISREAQDLMAYNEMEQKEAPQALASNDNSDVYNAAGKMAG